MATKLALSGDSIVTRRISILEDDGFQDIRDVLRGADISFTHLETLLHDFDREDTYPAAESPGTWLQSPSFVADELRWLGIDLVSHPSNHSLDYSYGGLTSTWEHLDRVGIPYAGTGENLAAARSPTYLETAEARIGLVSMTSTFTNWSRAGDQRSDLQGRPGVNPLRYRHVVDTKTLQQFQAMAKQFGWIIVQREEHIWEFTPPGLHNSGYRLIVDDDAAPTTRALETDVEGNLRAIREANAQADLVLVHVHAHEFHPREGVFREPEYIPSFARSCIDAGADIFVLQGSHNVRGLEMYNGAPIFYDLGDFFLTHETITRLPDDFYRNYEDIMDSHRSEATPSEAFEARGTTSYYDTVYPEGGYWDTPADGCILPVCVFNDELELVQIVVHPCSRMDGSAVKAGVPTMATGDSATTVLEHTAGLSEYYGTDLRIEDDVGVVDV